MPGGNDFAAHYSAWQAYFRTGVSPYSDDAAQYTQTIIYGRPAGVGEDQNRLTYPFYSIVIHGPFALIDYEAARAIYMTLLQVALFIGVLISMKLVSWKPRPWLLFFILAWSLFDYSQARGVILGQFAIFGFFSLVACLFLMGRKHDFWAGSILVLGTRHQQRLGAFLDLTPG